MFSTAVLPQNHLNSKSHQSNRKHNNHLIIKNKYTRMWHLFLHASSDPDTGTVSALLSHTLWTEIVAGKKVSRKKICEENLATFAIFT